MPEQQMTVQQKLDKILENLEIITHNLKETE